MVYEITTSVSQIGVSLTGGGVPRIRRPIRHILGLTPLLVARRHTHSSMLSLELSPVTYTIRYVCRRYPLSPLNSVVGFIFHIGPVLISSHNTTNQVITLESIDFYNRTPFLRRHNSSSQFVLQSFLRHHNSFFRWVDQSWTGDPLIPHLPTLR